MAIAHQIPLQICPHPSIRVRPIPERVSVTSFRRCNSHPCRRGDSCTFAHNDIEMQIWNQKLMRRHYNSVVQVRQQVVISHHPQVIMHQQSHGAPPSATKKQSMSKFHERIKEPLIMEDIKQPLSIVNYKEKFHKLLCWEEKEHISLLTNRCDGVYPISISITGYIPPGTQSPYPDNKKYGHINIGNGDIVAYAKQASEAVYLVNKYLNIEVRADILKDDYIGNRIYISFDKGSISSTDLTSDIECQFEVKHSYFDSLHNAVDGLSEEVIKRLLPEEKNFEGAVNAEGIYALQCVPREYLHILHLQNVSPNKLIPYQVALTCKSGAPPVLIAGPFGTGKTCFLASLGVCFIMQSPAHVLICAHHQATADTILNMYFKPLTTLRQNPLPATVIRIVPTSYKINRSEDHFIKNVKTFKEMHDQIDQQQQVVIITTLLTALQLRRVLPVGYFTHILIDEGAQVREPEAIAPLSLATRETKIIIAGDPCQVGPLLLVLGKEAREYGLRTSLLSRLRQHYAAIINKTKYLQADLMENYRCHKEITKFASDMFYKSSVITSELCSTIKVPYGFQHPLVFVCTSMEEISNYNDCINEKEAKILINLMKKFCKRDTNHKSCVMSSSRGQVTVLRNLKVLYELPVYVHPTYDIQGQEYDVLYISTCEPTDKNGETCNPTKSVCDRYVFNTAITRAKSLIISFGNPYLLLSIEKHMNPKYNCWSQYIRTCLVHDTFIVPDSIALPHQIDHFKRKYYGDIEAIHTNKEGLHSAQLLPLPQKVRHPTISAGASVSHSNRGPNPIQQATNLRPKIEPKLTKVKPPSLSADSASHPCDRTGPVAVPHMKKKAPLQHPGNNSCKTSERDGDRHQGRNDSHDSSAAGEHSIKHSADKERHNMEYPTLAESKHIKMSKKQRRQAESSHEEVELVKNTKYFSQYSRRFDLKIFDGPLTVENYKDRFHKLLCLEEKEHMSILANRCNGYYVVEFRNRDSIRKEGFLEYYKYYGVIRSIDGNDDNLAYAKHAGESANISIGTNILNCDFLRQNISPDGISVGFVTPEVKKILVKYQMKSGRIECKVSFELKHSYFDRQHEALENLPRYIIRSILPTINEPSEPRPKCKVSKCSLDLDDMGQMQALYGILKQIYDPVIIAGPFGTGKTRVLARAAYELVISNGNYRVLICTHHQTSADTFIDHFQSLQQDNHAFKAIEIVRIETFNYRSKVKEQYPKYFCSVRAASSSNPKIIVSTLGLSHHLRMNDISHILIDEAAQTRETEAIIPLQHAGHATKIVLAGDHCQVGPDVLVLGDMARKHGLSVSLLERLHKKFTEMGQLSNVFSLLQNYRSHSGLLMLPSSLFYKSTLKCNVKDSMAHPLAPFPLVFVCSSISNTNPPNASGIDKNEAKILAKMVIKYIIESWPDEWGDHSYPPEQVCIMTPSATQKSIISKDVRNWTRDKRSVVTVLKAYEIQGCQFTAVFMGTCETTDEYGVPNNTTKTIINHYVFNTALTRAKYLFVAVGNPLQLLDREKKLQNINNNHFSCWKEYIKRCVECKSFYLPENISQSERQQFTEVLQQQLYTEGSAPEDELIDTSTHNDSILKAYQERFEKFPEYKKSKLRLTRVDGKLSWKLKSVNKKDKIKYEQDKKEPLAQSCDYRLKMITFLKAEAIPLDPKGSIIHIRGKGNLRGALHDDIVEVTAFNDSESIERIGRVLSVVRTCHRRTLMCRPHPYNPTLFYPVDKKYPIISNLPKLPKELLEQRDKDIIQQGLQSQDVVVFKSSSLREDNIPEIKNVIPFSLAHNMIFVVKILLWNPKYRLPLGAVIHAVPKTCSSFHAERLLMIEHNVEYEKEDEEAVIIEANTAINIRDVSTMKAFTIDPEDAFNLDDALSLREIKPNVYHLSVHIVNAAREITYDSDIDKRAAIRGQSVYGGSKVMNIFPSQTRQKLSLTPNRACDVISISADVHITEHSANINNVQTRESKIVSCLKLSYHSAQAIMDGGHYPDNLTQGISYYDSEEGQPNLKNTLKLLYRIAYSLRTERLGEMAAKSYEVDSEGERECWETHLLVEEMMIWANNVVARRILKSFPTCALLRRQAPPNEQELDIARNTHCNVAQYSHRHSKLISDLQPDETSIVIALSTLELIKQVIREGNSRVLLNLLTDDSLFPQLNATSGQLRRIQQKAEYVAASGDTDDDSYHHYGLCLPVYTHFTSPLRRYADVVVQRLLTAMINGQSCTYYNQDKVQSICGRLNSTSQNAKDFEKKMKSLKLAIELTQSSQVYEATVTKSSEDEIELSFLKSELKVIPGRDKRFKMRHLLSKKEKTKSDSIASESMVYSWNITMISFDEDSTFPYDDEDLSYHKKSNDFPSDSNGSANVTMELYETTENLKMLRVVKQCVDIFPIVTELSPVVWRCIKEFLMHPSKSNMTKVQDTLGQLVIGPRTRSIAPKRVTNSPVIRSKISCGINVYNLVKVWMTWSTRESIMSPALQMIEIAPFFRICLQHNSHPAECFSDSHLENASKESYSSVDEYVKLWEKVLLAEASERSVRDNKSAIIYNAKIDWGQDSLVIPEEINTTLYELKKPVFLPVPSSIINEDNPFFKIRVGDMVCVRYGTRKCSKIRFVFHLVITEKNTEGEYVQLKSFGKDNIRMSEEMKALVENETCEIQVIRMSTSYQRVYKVLLSLRSPRDGVSELSKVVAVGKNSLKKLPRLYSLNSNPLRDNPDVKRLWSGNKSSLNSNQINAIESSLKQRFLLVQGPPGTGKSETGAHIAYALAMCNRIKGSNECVLYCAPTNKAVDVVLKKLDELDVLDELSSRLRILRLYGKSTQRIDFPGVYLKNDTYEVSESNYQCPEWAQKYALHWKIREFNSDESRELNEIEEQFKEDCKDGELIAGKELHRKHKMLIDGLEKVIMSAPYDIVLCTCNEAGSGRLSKGFCKPERSKETRFLQCVVDESGMAYEPETIVPMRLCEHVILLGDHQQLQPVIEYKPAKDNGLTTSLFERYATSKKLQPKMLKIQYRMHEEICSFPSKHFYNGKLKTDSLVKLQRNKESQLPLWPRDANGKIFPIMFCDIVGKEKIGQGLSKSNPEEAEKAVQVALVLTMVYNVRQTEIALMTPYKEQKKCLLDYKGSNLKDVAVATITESQGDEYGIVILSTVRSQPLSEIQNEDYVQPDRSWLLENLGFLTDQHEMNVGITRSKYGLIIIGNKTLLRYDDNWKALIDHYEERNCVADSRDFPNREDLLRLPERRSSQ